MKEFNLNVQRRIAAGNVANQSLESVTECLLQARKRAYDAEARSHKLQADLDALKAAHAWIKTSERLPDIAEGSCCDVLALIDGAAIVLTYTPDDDIKPWSDEFSNLYSIAEVTDWMQIPSRSP